MHLLCPHPWPTDCPRRDRMVCFSRFSGGLWCLLKFVTHYWRLNYFLWKVLLLLYSLKNCMLGEPHWELCYIFVWKPGSVDVCSRVSVSFDVWGLSVSMCCGFLCFSHLGWWLSGSCMCPPAFVSDVSGSPPWWWTWSTTLQEVQETRKRSARKWGTKVVQIITFLSRAPAILTVGLCIWKTRIPALQLDGLAASYRFFTIWK